MRWSEWQFTLGSSRSDVVGLVLGGQRQGYLASRSRLGGRACDRQAELDLESVRLDVAGGDGAAVGYNGVADDCQSESHAARRRHARTIDTVKRLEQQRDGVIRHARAVVANREYGIAILDAQANVKTAVLAGIEQCVADNVLKGATK